MQAITNAAISSSGPSCESCPSPLEFQSVQIGGFPAAAHLSRFTGASGVEECHIVVRPRESGPIEAQLEWIERAYNSALDCAGLDMGTAVFRRFFCSDLSNQAAALEASPIANSGARESLAGQDGPCAMSWVRQPPAPPVKVALWAWHIRDPRGPLEKSGGRSGLALRRGSLTHCWTAGMASPAAESTGVQTRSLLEKYAGQLHARGMTLSENTIRTWFYLQNIDVNYREFAAARRELFAMHGLTPGTHFIASTGIEGAHSNLDAKVAMDAYAISGICPGQVEHLAAPEHLSPTHIYGVTFERASSVAWRDRKQVFISGTASIDRFGQIMHPGNVERQLGRTLENIEALLGRAGASITDMAVFLVYIRDPGDYEIAWRMMRERFGDAPVEVLTAPVCRPGWLIEVEGMAIIHASNPELPEF